MKTPAQQAADRLHKSLSPTNRAKPRNTQQLVIAPRRTNFYHIGVVTMRDKLPDGVVLAMEQVVSGDSNPCKNCYFLGKKCPKDWTAPLGWKPSCINERDIIFREIESDER